MSSRLRQFTELTKRQDIILNVLCVVVAVAFLALAVINVFDAGDFFTIDSLFLTTVALLLAGVFMINPLYWMYTNGMLKNPFVVEGDAGAAAHDIHFEGTNRLFISVWGWLLLLTGVEVFLGYEHLPLRLMLTIVMGLSLVKAALIVAYFMHLRFERLSLFLTLVPMLVVCICLFLILFPDSFRARNLRYQSQGTPSSEVHSK
jgi:cytochrome c oxidase subunit 4